MSRLPPSASPSNAPGGSASLIERLRHHWRVGLGVGLAVFVLATLGALAIPQVYESSALLEVTGVGATDEGTRADGHGTGFYTFERRRTWFWNAPASGGIERVLKMVQWRDLRQVARSAPGVMLLDADKVSWTYGLESAQEMLVYVRQPRQGASLTLRLPDTMVGALVDAETGDQLQPLRIEGRPSEIIKLSVPPGRAVALVLRRSR